MATLTFSNGMQQKVRRKRSRPLHNAFGCRAGWSTAAAARQGVQHPAAYSNLPTCQSLPLHLQQPSRNFT